MGNITKRTIFAKEWNPSDTMNNRYLKASLPFFLKLFFAINIGMTISGDTKVWIVQSTSSQCYHVDKNCRTLKAAKHPIKSVTLQEAKRMGKRSCKVCSSI